MHLPPQLVSCSTCLKLEGAFFLNGPIELKSSKCEVISILQLAALLKLGCALCSTYSKPIFAFLLWAILRQNTGVSQTRGTCTSPNHPCHFRILKPSSYMNVAAPFPRTPPLGESTAGSPLHGGVRLQDLLPVARVAIQRCVGRGVVALAWRTWRHKRWTAQGREWKVRSFFEWDFDRGSWAYHGNTDSTEYKWNVNGM